jgi:hypothetical protein
MLEEQEFFDRAVLEIAVAMLSSSPVLSATPDTLANQSAAIARELVKERRQFIDEQPKGYPRV